MRVSFSKDCFGIMKKPFAFTKVQSSFIVSNARAEFDCRLYSKTMLNPWPLNSKACKSDGVALNLGDSFEIFSYAANFG